MIPAQEEPALGFEGGFTAGAVLAATALALVPLVRALGSRLVPRPPAFFARWGFTHVVSCALLAVAATILAALLPGEGMVAALLKTILVSVMLSAAVFALAKRLHPEGLEALGLRRGGNGRALALGVVAYLLLFPAWLGVVFLWPAVAAFLGIEVEKQAVLEGIVELEGGVLVLAVILATLIQPFFEEVVFRGFLQPLLVQNLRAPAGIAVTSLLFALLHGSTALLPIFTLSLILGWIQLRTQRLVAVWLVHAVHNGVILGLSLVLARS